MACALTCRRHAVAQLSALTMTTFCTFGTPPAAHSAQQLSFTDYPSGLRVAEITAGTGSGMSVSGDSRVTFHVYGRLVGKNGWVFMNTQADDEPLRLQCGRGEMIAGLEEGDD